MRRHPSRFLGASSLLLGAVAAAVMTVGVLGPSAAFAEDATPTQEPTEPAEGEESGTDRLISEATPGTAVCTLAGGDLDAISGMVVTEQGIYAVESGNLSAVTIHTINATDCTSTSKNYTFDPIDPQDLAVGADGSVYVADIGTTGFERPSVAVEKFTIGNTQVTPFRMTYAGGAMPHAEAMILDANDQPIIIAQEGAAAGVYKPSGPLVPDVRENLPELTKVGDFTPQQTGTENSMAAVGNGLVTGAAKSPDGSRVVIRTVSDAYEFEVGDDGDIAKAIVEGTPTVTRLPSEPPGGAIAYSLDGESFLTLGKKAEGATANPALLSYQRHIPPPEEPAGETPTEPTGEEKSWLEKLSFSELTRIVAAVGVVGLVLAIAGIVGIRRARRRRREEEDDYDDYDDDRRGRGRGRRGGRGGRDEYGHGYGEYDGYGEGGYGANGYEGGYADAGYGRGGAAYGANGYGGNGYAQPQQYGAEPQQYGAEQYGGQQGYDPYGQPQYGGEQYGQPQHYGADQYGGQDYGGEQYGGQQYGGQQYGGGHGYEDDFDPMQDPRRR